MPPLIRLPYTTAATHGFLTHNQSMSLTFVEEIPGLRESDYGIGPSLRTHGDSAFINSPSFIGRFSLKTGTVDWLHERVPVQIPYSTHELPRRIDVSGSKLWTSHAHQVVAELSGSEDGAAQVTAWHAATGDVLWEQQISIPDAAEWAESSPAWPGAQTEQIDAFIADDPNCLVVCLSRQSRTTRRYSREFTVDTLPPYGCQTDAIRLDTATGIPVWHASYPGISVGIIERQSFEGVWSTSTQVGVVDFETGRNAILHEFPNALGWPIRVDSEVLVSWHSRREVGVVWIDERGNLLRQGSWRQPRIYETHLHDTPAGLAVQTNQQALWWMGKEPQPMWRIRAKPYIYHVHSSPATDVFVGTDGRGGRLFAFDAESGAETLNLKPALGGAGTLSIVPAHDVLVANFWTSRTDYTSGSLLVVSMHDRSHQFVCDCYELLGMWEHGAVCRSSKDDDRITIVDVREYDH